MLNIWNWVAKNQTCTCFFHDDLLFHSCFSQAKKACKVRRNRGNPFSIFTMAGQKIPPKALEGFGSLTCLAAYNLNTETKLACARRAASALSMVLCLRLLSGLWDSQGLWFLNGCIGSKKWRLGRYTDTETDQSQVVDLDVRIFSNVTEGALQ